MKKFTENNRNVLISLVHYFGFKNVVGKLKEVIEYILRKNLLVLNVVKTKSFITWRRKFQKLIQVVKRKLNYYHHFQIKSLPSKKYNKRTRKYEKQAWDYVLQIICSRKRSTQSRVLFCKTGDANKRFWELQVGYMWWF